VPLDELGEVSLHLGRGLIPLDLADELAVPIEQRQRGVSVYVEL